MAGRHLATAIENIVPAMSVTTDAPQTIASGNALAWTAGVLAVLASLPALFAHGLIGDDWVAYYVFWTEGVSGFAHWMREVAHLGYVPPTLLFYYLDGDTPNAATRIAGLSCHCLSGVLLYRVLNQSSYTRAIAALTTALFMVTPFYVIRLTNNATYDFLLVFYLLSYLLMNSSSRLLRWLAPVCLLLSLSLETLMALEPLRLLLASRHEQSWRAWFTRLIPFGLTVALVVVLRFTILKKSGHYEGVYAPVHDIGIVTAALSQHLHAFRRAISYAYEQGFYFLGYRASAAVTLISITGFAWFGSEIFRTSWLLKSLASAANTIRLSFLAVAITLLGALPYALAGVYGDPTRAESRLLFPSQFGVLLLLAIVIQCFPAQRFRAAIAGGAIAVFALSMAHDGKWMLYDGLVTSDLLRQTRAALLADPEPKVVELRIPSSSPLFFRSRCLGAQDMNSAQTLLRDDRAPQSFIYTDNCGDFTNPDLVPRGYCPVSYLDNNRCPPRRETWLYNVAPGIPPLDEIGMVELLRDVLYPLPTSTGGRGELLKLTNDKLSPLPRAEYRPPCHRTAVHALLWLLALPVSGCENIPAGG